MSQAFFDRKMKTLFKRLDADQDGEIDENDFVKWGDKLISFGKNLSEDQKKKLHSNLKQLWSNYFCSIDKSGNSDGKVSCSELTDYVKKSLTDDAKKQSLRNTLPLIFECIDTDKDDAISKVEFGNYFKSFDINDQNVANQVFAEMDKDNDGVLSKKEFTEFGVSFFTSQNENDPSKNFFGQLV